MYYETMERVLRKTDKVVIEAPGVTSYLPLPEIKRRAAATDLGSENGQGQ
jgi:membrane protease subunit HflK